MQYINFKMFFCKCLCRSKLKTDSVAKWYSFFHCKTKFIFDYSKQFKGYAVHIMNTYYLVTHNHFLSNIMVEIRFFDAFILF